MNQKQHPLERYCRKLGRKEAFNTILGATAIVFGLKRISVGCKAKGEYLGIEKTAKAVDKWHASVSPSLNEEVVEAFNDKFSVFDDEFK